MKKTRIALGGISLLAALVFLAGCAKNSQTKEDSSKVEKTQTVATTPAAEKVYVVSGHPEWPPIMWKDGDSIVGAGTDLVAKIATDLGIKTESKYTGLWDEVQAKAKSGEVDMLAAAYKTSERETYMDYSNEYTIDPISLFVKKGKSFNYEKWDDLIGKKGIATVGDSYGQELDDFIAAKLNVTRVNTVDEAFKALEESTADYFLYAFYSGEKAISDKNSKDKVEIIPKNVAEEKFYITISKKSDLIKYLPQINDLIEKYKADGTIDALILENKNKYLKPVSE